MTAENDLSEADAWCVLDRIRDAARQAVRRQRLTENQLDALIEESLLWARSSGTTTAQNAPRKPKMPPVFPTGAGGNPT